MNKTRLELEFYDQGRCISPSLLDLYQSAIKHPSEDACHELLNTQWNDIDICGIRAQANELFNIE